MKGPTPRFNQPAGGYTDNGGGGGGASLSDATPQPVGTAAAGTDALASRDDHVHAHGNQAGGTLHPAATTSVAGFESAADKTKLDGIAASATNTPLSSTTPAAVSTTGAVGTGTTAARADHVHALGSAAADSAVVHVTGNESVAGVKAFSSSPTVPTPSGTTDAANKAYVDASTANLNPKNSVVAMTTSNVASLVGGITMDGVVVATGSRVLLTGQATASQNGIWLTAVALSNWTRPADYAAGSHASGSYLFVEQGTVHKGEGWNCTTDPTADIVDTNSTSWTQIPTVADLTASIGITKSGTNFVGYQVSQAIGATTVDWNTGSVFTKSITSTNTTFTFSNANDGQVLTAIITATTGTVTWPTVDWGSAGAPTQRANATDVYTFIKAGSTIYGAVRQ